jgi:hypothetical protein
MRPAIYLITFIKKLYNKLMRRQTRSHETKKINMEVPTMCKSRRDKDFIICTTMDFLEQNIKIKNYE